MVKKIDFLKIPALLYFSFLLLGIFLGVYILNSSIGNIQDLSIKSAENFMHIFFTNGGIILLIYISCIFTRLYAYLTYSANGLIHGVYFGWILRNNISLFLLIVPHGIFEIPCILASGYIVSKGEKYIRDNFKKYVILLLINELAILLCAFVESFITPYFAKYI